MTRLSWPASPTAFYQNIHSMILHTFKMLAMMSFRAETCCHLVCEHKASVECLYAAAYTSF